MVSVRWLPFLLVANTVVAIHRSRFQKPRPRPAPAPAPAPPPARTDILISRTSGLRTTERGGSDTFTVALTSRPASRVTVQLRASDATEGTVVRPRWLVFNPWPNPAWQTWSTERTVTVVGVDDTLADGDVEWTVETSVINTADAAYAALDPADVRVVNVDDDVRGGVRVYGAPAGGVLTTTEGGGTATFVVALTARPSKPVMFNVASTDTKEGVPVPRQPLRFKVEPDAWDVPVTVTVRGVDDDVADGDQAYGVRVAVASGDPTYKGIEIPNLRAVNLDDDKAGIEVRDAKRVRTTERGGRDTFVVALTSRPKSRVTVALRVSDRTEGRVVRPWHLVFNPWPSPKEQAWSTERTVTVVGVDDREYDGNVAWTLKTTVLNTADAAYAALNPADVRVVNVDDEKRKKRRRGTKTNNKGKRRRGRNNKKKDNKNKKKKNTKKSNTKRRGKGNGKNRNKNNKSKSGWLSSLFR